MNSRFAVIIFLASLFTGSLCEVKMVIDVIRHGARAPLFECEHFKDLKWDLKGELTPVGERQLCLLGMLRRQQYIGSGKLLPTAYDPSLIYVRSTPVNRTLMSAQAYLTCFYPEGLKHLNAAQMKHTHDWLKPPIKFEIDKKIIDDLHDHAMPYDMPAVPIQTVNESTEGLLSFNDCPLVMLKLAGYFLSNEYKNLSMNATVWKEFRKVFKNIKDDYYTTGINAYLLADLLICADIENRSPKDVTPAMIQGFKEYFSEAQVSAIKDDKINRVMMHDFVGEVLKHMSKVDDPKNKLKYVLYSGHDTTLNMILIGLKKLNKTIELPQAVPFASNILFELSEKDSKKTVKVLFNGKDIYKGEYEKFVKEFGEVGYIKEKKEDVCNNVIISEGCPTGFDSHQIIDMI
eukprot:TRINITY_DN10598_c0_g1_i12.p1 TRINITY_DN10598_c0_g1~~TRINITY_DN10598_c0_g1_i12.p1  ORF type:complete len:403 (+),score=92.00 TRINITY_DN10598_c0_g1_i12:126-1334(+)